MDAMMMRGDPCWGGGGGRAPVVEFRRYWRRARAGCNVGTLHDIG